MTDFIKEYYSLKEKKDNIFFMNEAIENANNSDGGPFGAVIIKDKNIVSNGNNKVTVDNDPPLGLLRLRKLERIKALV